MLSNSTIEAMVKAIAKYQSDKRGKELIQQTGDKAFGVLQGAGILGNVMQATSDIPGQEPNVKQSAIGGALSGLASGAAFGPIGALLGAGIGGVGGFISGSKNLEDHLLQLNQEQEMNMASKTVQPSSYRTGGVVAKSGIQTELGEVALIPELMELVATAAKQLHKDMPHDLVTDFFNKGTVIFSNKKMFDPKTITDKVIGYGQGHYEENKTYAPEQITVGDKFGDEEVTYAEAAKKLKNKIKVSDGSNKDIFDDITDAENKLTRMMYLNELIASQQEIDIPEESTTVPKFEYGGPVGVGVSNDYYANVLKKLEELKGLNVSERDKGKEDLNTLGKKLRGSILAQGGLSTLFTALQNPNTQPVIQDNTFIEDAYQQLPLSFIESQVAPYRGGVNSMAQMLLSNGVDPGQVPSILATTQGRALDAEGQLRSRFIQDRVNTDRGKYQALRDNLTTNKTNMVAAENATTEGYNQKFAQFGSILAQMLGQNRDLTAGKVQAGRNLDKSFMDNNISLFRTESDISGNQMQFDDQMRRINERLNELRSHRDQLNHSIDLRNLSMEEAKMAKRGVGLIGDQLPMDNVPALNLGQPLTPSAQWLGGNTNVFDLLFK
jgi:hypothetical protein